MRNNLNWRPLSQKRMRADAASLDFAMLARGAAAAARVCGAGRGGVCVEDTWPRRCGETSK